MDGKVIAGLLVLFLLLFSPAPGITTVAPNGGLSNTTVTVTVEGKNFSKDTTVKLARAGEADIDGTAIQLISKKQLRCQFDLKGRKAGAWDVVVVRKKKSATLRSGFTIEDPVPQVAAITPGQAVLNSVAVITDLEGKNFRPGARVLLSGQRMDIGATNVKVLSNSQISCEFDLKNAAPGMYSVKVVNEDGKSGSLADAFLVENLGPTVLAIAPARGTAGTATAFELTGKGFRPGATVSLLKSGAEIRATQVNVVSDSRMVGELDLAGKATGIYDVKVTNDDGKSGTLTEGFTLEYPGPRVDSVQPRGGSRGTTIEQLTLVGKGFRPGATVSLTGKDGTIQATEVKVSGDEQIRCRLDLADAPVGNYDLVVRNDDGKSATVDGGFAVEYPGPALQAVRPQNGQIGTTVDKVTLDGAGFRPGASVTFVGKDRKIAANDVKVINDNLIVCRLNLEGAAAGGYDVRVANDDGKAAELRGAFVAEYPAPTVTLVQPANGVADTIVVSVDLAGTGFRPGATVVFSNDRTTLSVLRPQVVSPTRITGIVDLKDASAGTYDVKVTNTDGKSGVLKNGFTVKSLEPSVKGVTPDRGFNNGKVLLTISGANFDSGSTAKLVGNNGGISLPGLNLKLEGASKLSGYFDIKDQPPGQYDVVVTDSRGRSGVLKDGFTVEVFVPSALELNERLKAIYFDFDKANLRADQLASAEQNLAILQANPQLYILLGGHTDERGSQEYNLNLSRRRSEAVQEYLVRQGIDPKRITIYAYGKEHPLKPGHDEEAWALNRRVDILVGEAPPTREQGLQFQDQ
ncbi:OmpA family protein [Hydrogenispora ethanolica]|uniref:OmpA family protein n=1 Tax=Hydrogenispora ethanolica TaxID=1082276 RepID=A0A4R1RD38_HYDET|nr:OmpA family protein [Hydrogenispora ethanolica]TCL63774.1 OmpA family protein [Hydrogenispora ethanolica]